MSRPRVVLRAALLLAGGAFMLWKAAGSHRAARQVPGADGLLLDRLALVWGLVGALALATAAVALLSLRSRARRHTLQLKDKEWR